MRQESQERKKDKLECFAVVDSTGKCSACIKFHRSRLHMFYVCNLHATAFDTLEELALNLDLRFPGCRLEHESKMHEIVGISQEVLRECLQKGEPLL